MLQRMTQQKRQVNKRLPFVVILTPIFSYSISIEKFREIYISRGIEL